jgi:hypothetical protein
MALILEKKNILIAAHAPLPLLLPLQHCSVAVAPVPQRPGAIAIAIDLRRRPVASLSLPQCHCN